MSLRILLAIVLCFSTLSCTIATKRGTTPGKVSAQTGPKKSSEPPDVPLKPDAPLPEDKLKATVGDIRGPLVEWLRKTKKVSYARLAQQAQKLIDQNGVPYLVDIKELPSKVESYKTMILPDGRELYISTANSYEGACGEQFVKLSVLRFENGLPVISTNQGPVVAKDIYLEKTVVKKSIYDPEGVVIFRPHADGPWNVTSTGDGIVWQFDLKQSLLEEWWRRLQRKYRDLREERPFIVISITTKGFRVETYEKNLLPGQYEQASPEIKDAPYLRRRIYKPKGTVVDFEAACT